MGIAEVVLAAGVADAVVVSSAGASRTCPAKLVVASSRWPHYWTAELPPRVLRALDFPQPKRWYPHLTEQVRWSRSNHQRFATRSQLPRFVVAVPWLQLVAPVAAAAFPGRAA